MENQLIQICLVASQIYDTCSETYFQRASNNSEPLYTNQELITIWFFVQRATFARGIFDLTVPGSRFKTIS